MKPRQSHTQGQCIKLNFLSIIMSKWDCLQKWCGTFLACCGADFHRRPSSSSKCLCLCSPQERQAFLAG